MAGTTPCLRRSAEDLGNPAPYCRPTGWAPPATWMAAAFIKLPLCSLDLKAVESPLGRASPGEKLKDSYTLKDHRRLLAPTVCQVSLSSVVRKAAPGLREEEVLRRRVWNLWVCGKTVILTRVKEGGEGGIWEIPKGRVFHTEGACLKKEGKEGRGEIGKKERGVGLQGWSGRDMRAGHTGPVLFKGH